MLINCRWAAILMAAPTIIGRERLFFFAKAIMILLFPNLDPDKPISQRYRKRALRTLSPLFLPAATLAALAVATPLAAQTPAIPDGFDIKSYLGQLAQKSLELQAQTAESEAALLRSEAAYGQFDGHGFVKFDATDSANPQTSPFAPTSSTAYAVSTGYQKTWQSGWQSRVAYTVTDNQIGYDGRPDVNYIQPDLSLAIGGNLFRDILAERLRLVGAKSDADKRTIHLQLQITKKRTLVTALALLSDAVELQDEIALQKQLCYQIAAQQKVQKDRYDRGSIPIRDYLLSSKELNRCQASRKTLEKNLQEIREQHRASFGVAMDEFGKIDAGSYNRGFRSLFEAYQQQAKFDINQDPQILAMRSQLTSLNVTSQDLAAQGATDLGVELRAGLKGADSAYGAAHGDLGKAEYPYVMASVTWNFPQNRRDNLIALNATRLSIKAIEQRLALATKERQSRVLVLADSLAKDFAIYRYLTQNVALSARILEEGRKDFDNGRIDIITLTEYQKGLTDSQRQLSGLRKSIAAKTIEYLDYYNFFTQF